MPTNAIFLSWRKICVSSMKMIASVISGLIENSLFLISVPSLSDIRPLLPNLLIITVILVIVHFPLNAFTFLFCHHTLWLWLFYGHLVWSQVALTWGGFAFLQLYRRCLRTVDVQFVWLSRRRKCLLGLIKRTVFVFARIQWHLLFVYSFKSIVHFTQIFPLFFGCILAR